MVLRTYQFPAETGCALRGFREWRAYPLRVFAESKSLAQYTSLREDWATVPLERQGGNAKSEAQSVTHDGAKPGIRGGRLKDRKQDTAPPI
jgi:hypothetical protein